MEQALNQFNSQVQNLPFYDTVTGLYQSHIGERFSTKDPFYEKIPKQDPRTLPKGKKPEYKEIRRRPPANITETQRKLWKKIMKRAWYHDRNFCGCMPIDLGCGMISIISIIPIIGSLIAYKMHYKMIKMCHQAGCPPSIEAIMVGNIGVDFMMTLVPLLGILLSWMKASSTRNAALFDTWLREESMKHDKVLHEEKLRQQQLSKQTNQPATATSMGPQLSPSSQTGSKVTSRQVTPDVRVQTSPTAAASPSAPKTSTHLQSPPPRTTPVSRKPVQSNYTSPPATNTAGSSQAVSPRSISPQARGMPTQDLATTASHPTRHDVASSPEDLPQSIATTPRSGPQPYTAAQHAAAHPENSPPASSSTFRPPPAGTYYNVEYS